MKTKLALLLTIIMGISMATVVFAQDAVKEEMAPVADVMADDLTNETVVEDVDGIEEADDLEGEEAVEEEVVAGEEKPAPAAY